MIGRVRRFSQKFGTDRIVPRTEPKEVKDVRGFKDKADKMKAVFGQDYVSPYEKYDLQLPRSSIVDGPQSLEERLHEKDGYRLMRRLGKITVAGFLAIFAWGWHLVDRDAKRAEKDKEEWLKQAVTKQLMLEKFNEVLQRRKEEVKEMKNKSK